MLCDDCLFEMGYDEYEFQYNQHRFYRYTCSKCQEIVPLRSRVNDNFLEERIIKYIDRKSKRMVRWMEGYICPNRGCKTELHFEMIECAKIRVYTQEGKKKIYNAYCPKCEEYMQVDEYNRKIN